MKRIYSIIILLLFGVGCFAQNTQADAEYLLIRKHYVVNDDGTSDLNFRKEIKIIRNRALTAYADKGETFIVYNPEFETLTINESYTIRADGSKIYTPKNAFVEQLPSNCTDCGRYNGIRELAVIHTGMEYGCIIVLDYTIHRKSDIIEESIIFNEDCPIKKYEVMVELPKNQNLYYNFKPFYLKALSDTSNSYSYNMERSENRLNIVFENLNQTYKDTYLPSSREMYPYVEFTNYKDVSVKYSENHKKLPIADTFLSQLKKSSAREFIKAIADYVRDKVKLNNISPALLNYKYSDAETTWQSNCGTIFDKAVLLSALLNQAGFEANVISGQRTLKNDVKINAPEKTVVEVRFGNITYEVSPVYENKELKIVNVSPSNETRDNKIFIEKSPAYDSLIVSSNTVVCDNIRYIYIQLPKEDKSIDINPSMLSISRKAPLKVNLSDEYYHYTVTLPENVKMLCKNIQIKRNRESCGSIFISIRQKGRNLDIIRELRINKDIILNAEDYEFFRQMMIEWQQYLRINLKEIK